MELDQRLTFLPIFYQNVAGLSADDLPGHRITLQAEDETSCSTSNVNFDRASCIQISILFHFRKKLVEAVILSYSNLSSIGYAKSYDGV